MSLYPGPLLSCVDNYLSCGSSRVFTVFYVYAIFISQVFTVSDFGGVYAVSRVCVHVMSFQYCSVSWLSSRFDVYNMFYVLCQCSYLYCVCVLCHWCFVLRLELMFVRVFLYPDGSTHVLNFCVWCALCPRFVLMFTVINIFLCFLTLQSVKAYLRSLRRCVIVVLHCCLYCILHLRLSLSSFVLCQCFFFHCFGVN